MFSVHTTPEKKTENATITITVHLDLCLRKTRVWKSHKLRDAIVLEKLFFKNGFRPL